ncbi:type I restriction modification DNA specificity domain protein [Haemophilus parainfluenzae ATCC 33392]|uniref:Restriction endonuclease subunit S n=1 Tax=Haemophilus parainfluenzae ATCC 33392 TaxID=888828 RepID=A0ABD7ZEZ8_HAEPA|nr:restriction endonuclease subunit S [Haemophilus parainfluenzae]EGC72202.1 type I restriction modification DNA specificity domain protein [Haemophilus parainfluenzae ATCC 33392]KFM00042.1 type I restriction modification DNA specificity domain protein [Haemophilus parainfluenzae ATCC 33392]QQB23773.1 restriction endonuclease subunit S [Haemophilus parainfluenzae]WMS23555.1 restriction endonuclease subunit S [Haemophilus parainfluenzae ATCC 33392]STO95766.1 Type I restriction enzyme specificit
MKNNRTFLEKLLDGAEVKWIPLGDVADYEQPTKYLVNSTVYNDNYPTPVLTAGKTFILGYTNEDEGIYFASKSPVIIFDDFTTANKWVDFDFKAKSSAMKMITSKNEKFALLKYIYYWLNTLPNNQIDGDHKRQWISNYANKLIPIPPLSVQTEIVKILDALTALTSELTSELTLRRKQYEYYREKLLSEEELGKVGFEWKTLDQISENLDSKRKPITSGLRTSGKIPYYGASGIVDYVEDYIFDGDFLLISEDGANLLARNTPIAFSATGKIWVNNHAHILKFNSYEERRFIEFYLNKIDLTPYISGAAQPKLNKKNLNSIKIPIPSIPKQQHIVSILDKFETLTNSITEGLPLAIEQSQKRYEYYRELLLNFPGRE